MKPSTTIARIAPRARGISLVEVMVGLVIGMIAVAVIFQVFATAEGLKRNTTSTGEAQQNGLFSTFTLGLELANAGNGLAAGAESLATCADTGNVATTLRPIPVFVNPSGTAKTPDTFIVNYSVATRVAYPAQFMEAAAAGAAFKVQSPNGFAVGDMVAAISGAGDCELTRITASAPEDTIPGTVVLSHSATAKAYPSSSVLFNFGNWDRAQRMQYGVYRGSTLSPSDCEDATKEPCVLRAVNLNDPDAPPQPIASNIVNMKVMLGIDNTADGYLDTWVEARNNAFQTNNLLAATLPVINQVKAVRIGVVVRSNHLDREITTSSNWSLFDGTYTGTIAPLTNGGYRYRAFETIVPLRNQLWNPQL